MLPALLALPPFGASDGEISFDATPTRPFVKYLGSGNGNGSHAPQTEAHRLAHVEELLLRMQTVLETQFQRIADIQVLIDRLNAERDR